MGAAAQTAAMCLTKKNNRATRGVDFGEAAVDRLVVWSTRDAPRAIRGKKSITEVTDRLLVDEKRINILPKQFVLREADARNLLRC